MLRNVRRRGRPIARARRAFTLAAIAFLGGSLCAAAARAECAPANGLSPCIDANSLWLTTGATRFFTLTEGRVLAPGRVAVAVTGAVSWSPLRFVVASPDVSGREIRALDRVIEQHVLLAMGLGRSFELGLDLGVILNQRGAGLLGLTAQSAPPVPSSAERDPRLALSYARELARDLWLKPRVAVGVPLGDTSAYASAGAFTVAPALPCAWSYGRFAAASELGLRLGPTRELGTLRWGSQASFGLGLGYDVLPNRWLALGLEGLLLVPIVATDTSRARALAVRSELFVAEWLLSARTFPERDANWSFAVGAGAGLATSSQRVGDGPSEPFVAPTSPGFRALAELRYVP